MAQRLPQHQRDAIAEDIRLGRGCNEIARLHGVSAGVVSKIAREHGLFFERCVQTALAASSRRIDSAAARAERQEQLVDELLALPQTTRQRDGKETRAYRRLSYKLYDLQRHHG